MDGGAKQVALDYRSSYAPRFLDIDPNTQTFEFSFADGTTYAGAPWDLISSDEKLPANVVAAALIYKSACAIWETMNFHFNRQVCSSIVSLFARAGEDRAPFTPIPSDHWALYSVTDWENGAAISQDGRVLFSIHAEIARNAGANTAGRKPIYNSDQIKGEVFRAFKKKGPLDRNGEVGWQGQADVERLIRDFCVKTMGKEPVRSTLQKFAREAIEVAGQRLKVNN